MKIRAAAHGTGKRRLGILALAIGFAVWVVAVAVSMGVDDERVAMVLLPLWIPIGSLAGQGLNVGTIEAPLYEATPVHLVAHLAGIGLSLPVYVALTYAWLRWRNRSHGVRLS